MSLNPVRHPPAPPASHPHPVMHGLSNDACLVPADLAEPGALLGFGHLKTKACVPVMAQQ